MWKTQDDKRKRVCQGSSAMEGTSQGYTSIFWAAEGTSQHVTIFEKWKNPTSALHRKRTWVQALPGFSTWGKSLYSGPSPGPSVICDLLSRPRAQISNQGRACTHALLPYLMWSFFPRASFKMVVPYAGWDSGERGCWLLGGATVMMTVFIHTAENEIFLMFCWRRDCSIWIEFFYDNI